ncbi:parB-like partition protein (plasmid) [Gloeothece citriformis PCC 7424]|uniref:ParB-like partition protein n=1 Tax=Gloeothece citriformis (strain PCC 7424) TaxID=65393 RepID=B7KMV2_GLOC7|nr:ParB/RepB/Spo0J family partition protein [Gloeothece citriformis]ACK74124.1 parB-like partition protein [Gloeothece citriformis PCC 7424]
MSPSKQKKPFAGKLTTPSPSWLTTDEVQTTSEEKSLIKLSDIHLPSTQPRHYFDPQSLKGLADSISQHGILQPLLVRPLETGGYELVAGERRYRAAGLVGLTEVPVVVKELTDEESWQLALIENLQREDLNPVEETEGILQLLAFKLGIAIREVSPLLHRLQKEQKNLATSRDNNVIGKELPSPTSESNLIDETSEAELLLTDNNVIGKTTEEESEPDNNIIGKTTEDEIPLSNNVIGKVEQEEITPSNNVIVQEEEVKKSESNSQLAVIESVFNDLGLMTWESFVNNRLPLLNLPENITEALRKGQIAYTKAKAIALVKDDDKRSKLLTEAIEQELSLSQIKEKIIALQPLPQSTTTEISDRLKNAYQKVKKTRIWEDNAKRKKLEKLLNQLEALINES